MKATNSLLKVLLTKNLPPNMLIKLFDQTIIPVLTYASEIWGTFSLQSKTVSDGFGNLTPEKQYLKTDTEQTCLYFYKRLLMVNKNTSNLATLGELGRYPIQIIIIIRIIKFWYRINELGENSLLKETLNEQLRAQNTDKNQWIHFVNQILNSLKGELQRENKLISYERAFKMLENDMYIAGIGQVVLELLSFKVESGNHQRGISLLQKFSDIFGNMRLVPLKMTSHLTSHNFQILKIEIFSKLCKI